jgi:amino acid permease
LVPNSNNVQGLKNPARLDSFCTRGDYFLWKPQDEQFSTSADYAFGILNSFGIIALSYGGHSVLPDLQATLTKNTKSEASACMMKGLWLLISSFSLVTSSAR